MSHSLIMMMMMMMMIIIIIIIIIIYSTLAVFSAVCLSVRLSFGHHELSLYLAVYVHLKMHLNEYQINR